MSDRFYSNTISGVELQVKFAFPKIFFTKDIADKNKKVYYDVGTVVMLNWGIVSAARAKTVLSSVKAIDLPSGTTVTQGSMVFKVFHKDSLSVLKSEIIKGINGGQDTIETVVLDDSPFILLDRGDSVEFETKALDESIDWVQLPFFDVILASTASDEQGVKTVRTMDIKSMKIFSEGFAESLESLETNSLVSFIAIEGVGDWKEAV